MKIGETTKLQIGTTLQILDVSGSERGHLRGKTASVVAPYAGGPANQTPITGVCGSGFGGNLYSGDVVKVVSR